ncbi:MAG: hypothetical protein JEZ12_21550 [Desulfobacterium sp.]|nr:hypothetical protein [Desulfobacterium sp.]
MTVIICDICKQPIATIDRKTVHAPITGDQLHSPMPKAGVPALIPDYVDWVNMRCVRCHKRPFINDYILTTDKFEKIELKKKSAPKPKERGPKSGK